MTGDEMQKILFDAGVRVTEAAELFRVSRHALYGWFAGIPARNKFVYENSVKLLSLMKSATIAGYLPVPCGTRRLDRLPLIKNALRKIYRPTP